jgi:glycosyltransferase involved in cell wall biosynthesis
MTPHEQRPLRLAVDLSFLREGGENGGIKPFLFETLLWLGRQQRTPLQFLFLTCSKTHTEVRDQLARVQDELYCVRHDGGALPRGDEFSPAERLALPPSPALLWEARADVLYCPFGSATHSWPGIPAVCTIVDVLHRDFPYSLDHAHIMQREKEFVQTIAVADALQCNSSYVQQRLTHHYGVPAERMFTVYNAVHARFGAQPSPGANGRPMAPSLPVKGPFFFYPANTWKHKNHEVLLLAYNIYRALAADAKERPWPLCLTGHEDERWSALQKLAANLGLTGEDSVHFHGYVPDETLARLWREAGALVFPSLHEGFGIPLLEAMEHGVPIISSPDASLAEVGGQQACLYADTRNPEKLAAAMLRMASDETFRMSLAAAGQKRLQDFSQDREMGRLLDALVRLAGTKPAWRPAQAGIFPDGWTERSAILALPDLSPAPKANLRLRFAPMPVARRLRLRAGRTTALGGFDLPGGEPATELTIPFRPEGGVLRIEAPDASNLNPADERIHGVRLLEAELILEDGRQFDLLAAPRV